MPRADALEIKRWVLQRQALGFSGLLLVPFNRWCVDMGCKILKIRVIESSAVMERWFIGGDALSQSLGKRPRQKTQNEAI
jgi:hypothetical protein